MKSNLTHFHLIKIYFSEHIIQSTSKTQHVSMINNNMEYINIHRIVHLFANYLYSISDFRSKINFHAGTETLVAVELLQYTNLL